MDPRTIVVFLGPSLSINDARNTLRARYFSPVQCGDVLRVRRLRPRVIAIIDGLFETTAAVWHKEILLALDEGIAVFGAASMGALRAAELAPFGMIGIGKIFEAYRDGVYTDDDEVALLHGTSAYGYPEMSEAMVNIRATVAKAIRAGVISPESGERVIQCAKDTFFHERSLHGAIERVWGANATGDEPRRFLRFIKQGGYVNQKRLDASALLHHISGLRSMPPRRHDDATSAHPSCFILKLQAEVMCRPFASSETDLPNAERVAQEARLLGSTYRLMRRLAQLMSIAHAIALSRGISVTRRDLLRNYARHDFGLGPAARTLRWVTSQDLDGAARRGMLERLAVIRALVDAPESSSEPGEGYERYLLALLRIDGRYVRWRPTGKATGAGVDRVVLRNAEERGGIEFQLYRRVAKLWRVVDRTARQLGVTQRVRPQVLSDEFRRARGLNRAEDTHAWLRANNLDAAGYVDLLTADAKLALLWEHYRIHTLGLLEPTEPVCWLHDAIRLAGLYPRLKRRLARAPILDGRPSLGRKHGSEWILRQHFARLGESIPVNVEEYARSLDFIDGETGLRAALMRSVRA